MVVFCTTGTGAGVGAGAGAGAGAGVSAGVGAGAGLSSPHVLHRAFPNLLHCSQTSHFQVWNIYTEKYTKLPIYIYRDTDKYTKKQIDTRRYIYIYIYIR